MLVKHIEKLKEKSFLSKKIMAWHEQAQQAISEYKEIEKNLVLLEKGLAIVNLLKTDIPKCLEAVYAKLYFFNSCFILLCKLQG
jgi:hypothetical protein